MKFFNALIIIYLITALALVGFSIAESNWQAMFSTIVSIAWCCAYRIEQMENYRLKNKLPK